MMRRALSSVLCLLALAGPGWLSAAHEWRIGLQEAGLHAAAPDTGSTAAPPDDHAHHDEGSCRVCPGLSRLRDAALGRSVPRTAVARAALGPRDSGAAPRETPPFLLPAPRGPPAA